MPATERSVAVEEVAHGVLRVACTIGGAKPLYQHVLTGGDRWIWVDAGIASTPTEFLLGSLPWRAVSAHTLVVTHGDVDHFGGAAELRTALPQLVVAAHTLDAPWIENVDLLMRQRYLVRGDADLEVPAWRQTQLRKRAGAPVRVDVRLGGGESIGAWQVLHVPGHSPGHLALWNAADKVAVVGDAVLGWGVADLYGKLVAPPPYTDVAPYIASLDCLSSLGAELVLSAHWPMARGRSDVALALSASRAAVEAIGRAVSEVLDTGAPSLADVCRQVAAQLGRWPQESWSGLADAVAAHCALAARRVA
jgi:glyoxylase-like metal-dependent hydrolase (beta-lactamase superfamily II)